MKRSIFHLSSLIFPLLLVGAVVAAPLVSGPQPGQRPLPFTSNIVCGPQRGKQHCYVCELKDEPAVLVFARRMDEPTGRLMRSLAEAGREHAKEKLFVWFVFLGAEDTASETTLERSAYAFARRNGAGSMPISALGEPEGPPGYLISPEAETTVLMFRSGKVRTNRAFRAKEWTNRAADSVLKDLPALLTPQP